MYLPGSPGNILALDAATGELKWKYHPAPGSPRGGTNRGVAVGEGKVFSTGGGNALIALDQKSGELLWTTKVGDRGTTVAPALYYNGLVYMGTSGGEGGIRAEGLCERGEVVSRGPRSVSRHGRGPGGAVLDGRLAIPRDKRSRRAQGDGAGVRAALSGLDLGEEGVCLEIDRP